MKFLWYFIAVMTVAESAVDIEKTVKQVQNILQSHSELPRLTREEIIQLMNDIKAEDEKTSTSKQSSKESNEIKITTPYSTSDNEIYSVTQTLKNEEILLINDVASVQPDTLEATTKKSEPSLTVVLPYTPRDGSSLQELYTRPPRVEIVPASEVTPQPIKTSDINQIQINNVNKQKEDFTAELRAFLDAHGLKAKPGQDHFLLPLEGFKPLPPAKIIDGNIDLPENILLTYDLISPAELKASKVQTISPTNFLYEPLRPEIPFELDTSSSEIKEVVYPYDMPKSRKPKSAPNYEPIDYDSVKVIPLNKGINPIEDVKSTVENEQSKRQTNSTDVTEASITTEEPKAASDTVQDSSPSPIPDDAGASIADLEDSFGGAAPSLPGDSELPPPRKNGFYWMLDWNSFLEVGDGDTKVNIRFEPKLGDPQMFLPVTVP